MQPVATGQRPAILSGWLYVPYEALGSTANREKLKARLTFRPKFQDPDAPREIALFHDWKAREYLGVPRAWGLNAFRNKGLSLIDKTTRGSHEVIVPRLPSFDHPRVLDPVAQRAFYDALVERRRTSRGFIGKAGTGTGKTVVSLREAGAEIKRPTLILLHLERLMWQWFDEIGDKLGVDPSRIGVVQSDRCEYEGKDFVVGMLHSVAQREYPRAFYQHFGHVIYDEVHKVGSQFFAPVAYRFPAYNWLGLSATVERTDEGEVIFFCHLGRIGVTSQAKTMPMDVQPVRFISKDAPKGKSNSTRLKWLAGDKLRNRWLAQMIVADYRAGRNGLYVSEYVGHVQDIMYECELLGVPREDMGQFTGQRHSGPFCVLEPETVKLGEYVDQQAYEQEPGVWVNFDTVKPILACRLRRRADGSFAPVLGPVRDDKGRVRQDVKKKDIPSEELDDTKRNRQLVFATYGMIVEGIDEPRWDLGMDLLPRGKATQLVGRIRRPLPGKPRPLWRTPFDQRCSISKRLFQRRCGDYRETSATIKEIA